MSVRVAARRLAAAAAAARVVAAAATCNTTIAAVSVPRRLDCVRLSNKLRLVAAVDTVDFLMTRASVLPRRAVGNVRVAVGRARLRKWARGTVILCVGRVEGQRR